MSLPFATKTITIFSQVKTLDEFNKTVTKWVKSTISGCSWSKRQATVSIGETQIASDDVIIKVPMQDEFSCNVGDVVFLGEVLEDIADNGSPNSLFDTYSGNVTVTGVSDYADGSFPLAHYEIVGV